MTRSRRPSERRPSDHRTTVRRSRLRRSRGLPRRALLLAGLAAGLVWLSRGWWWPSPPSAQLILVLGGDVAREQMAAQLARQRGLPVVVSGGSNPEYAHWLFAQRQGLPAEQVLLDYRAQDTVSNFTSLANDLRRARIRHALLVTSSDHMPRALLVGRIVAGSRGIHLTPVPVDCGGRCIHEPGHKLWLDGLRSGLWVLSGVDFRDWAAARLPGWLMRPAGDRGGPSAPDPAGR